MREKQDVWCNPLVLGGQGGHLADFKGVCEGKYDDEDSSSDALSSTSSTNTSSSTLSEEDEYMEEVSAASAYLHQITQQALNLLDDMETDTRAPKSARPRYPPSFSNNDYAHSSSRSHPNKDTHKPKKVKRSKSTSSSSRRRSSSQNTDPPSLSQMYSFGNIQKHSFMSLQLKTHDIVESAQDLLKSIERDSYDQFAQQQISDALQEHRLEYHRRRALTLQQQQKQQQQQIIHLHQSILQQRRQVKRSRRYSKSSRVVRSSAMFGRLSPIPEVHTPASSVTHDYD